MKKVFLLVVAIVMIAFSGNDAQAQTKIGKEHLFDLGIHYGYGTGVLGNFMGANMDFNFANNNLRIRLDIDALQAPYKASALCVGLGANVQYLIALSKDDALGLYLYPTLGLGMDFTNALNWPAKFGIGFDAGGGFEWQFAGNWALFLEAVYQVRLINQSHFAPRVGFYYAF